MNKNSIYDFTVKSISGEEISMADFKNKTLLIVNVASRCGFTKQYTALEQLYQQYKDKGFTILGFPCNQFHNQEPGTDKEIKNFCETNYQITFPILSKIEVNGPNAHPLYVYIKNARQGLLGTKAIKWNFTKFLVDKNGAVTKRYAPYVTPESINKDLVELLS